MAGVEGMRKGWGRRGPEDVMLRGAQGRRDRKSRGGELQRKSRPGMVMFMGDKGEDAGQHGKGEGMKASMWESRSPPRLAPAPEGQQADCTASEYHCAVFSLSTFHPLVETKPLLFLVSS